MSRNTPTPLVRGRKYTMGGHKRRWTLEDVDRETGQAILRSGDEWQMMAAREATKRLKLVWGE